MFAEPPEPDLPPVRCIRALEAMWADLAPDLALLPDDALGEVLDHIRDMADVGGLGRVVIHRRGDLFRAGLATRVRRLALAALLAPLLAHLDKAADPVDPVEPAAGADTPAAVTGLGVALVATLLSAPAAPPRPFAPEATAA